VSSKVTLQIVVSLTDTARGVIYDRNMAIPHVYGTGVICDDRNSFIIQATGLNNLRLSGACVIYRLLAKCSPGSQWAERLRCLQTHKWRFQSREEAGPWNGDKCMNRITI